MRDAGWSDHNLAGGHIEGVLANGEGGAPLLHQKDLGVRVPVQFRAASGRTVEQDDAHRRISIEIPFELVRVPEIGKSRFVDKHRHAGYSFRGDVGCSRSWLIEVLIARFVQTVRYPGQTAPASA